MKRANTSLPTPLSPVINVFASLAAILAAAAMSSLSAGLLPTICGAGSWVEGICSTSRMDSGPLRARR